MALVVVSCDSNIAYCGWLQGKRNDCSMILQSFLLEKNCYYIITINVGVVIMTNRFIGVVKVSYWLAICDICRIAIALCRCGQTALHLRTM